MQAKVLYDREAKYTPNEIVYTPQASYVSQPVYHHAPPPATKAPPLPPKAPPTFAPLSVTEPAVYSPKDYSPAPISYPHNPVYNLVVSDAEHHKIKHLKEPKHVSPLAPPPPKEKNHHHDPYLKTEEELAHKDFSGPFFYASTKKIIRKEKKDGKPEHAYLL